MTRNFPNLLATLALALAGALGSGAALADFDSDLLAIQTRWADANYSPDGDAKEAAFDKLITDAAAFTARNPGRAEPLIWEGIVLSTTAGVKGGLGALGLAKDSRAKLEAALKIDPKALQGSAYTSLGTLYHKVPGFPVGFGSDKKAREYLEKSLAINPDGIDPNYFYGEFLYDEDDYAGAKKHLEKALQAAPRPSRQSADEGRRREIRALLAKIPAR
ncbi:MAG: tetratricopeptide repeat protein [Gammaproteobacteria bacterium]